MNKDMAPKLSSVPFFFFLKHLGSYLSRFLFRFLCLVCGGRGSLAHFWILVPSLRFPGYRGLNHLWDPRSGRTPKWGFRGSSASGRAHCASTRSILGARCFQNGHFGRIFSTLYFTVFQSLGRHASARRVSHGLPNHYIPFSIINSRAVDVM